MHDDYDDDDDGDGVVVVVVVFNKRRQQVSIRKYVKSLYIHYFRKDEA